VSCDWAWYSWQDAGNFGEVLAGLTAVVVGSLSVGEYLRRGYDERRSQAREIEVREMRTGQLVAFNHSGRFVGRTAWYLPFKPEDERLVWAYHVAHGAIGGTRIGIQTDSNTIEPGSSMEYELEKDKPSDGCYLIFRDANSRWWKRGIDGKLSKYKTSGRVVAGPPPEDAPSEQPRRERKRNSSPPAT
jgi:hypothetical protein